MQDRNGQDQERAPGRASVGGNGAQGERGYRGPRDMVGADFERGDWEGAGEWHGSSRPAGPSGGDRSDFGDAGFGEARGGNGGGPSGGSPGYGGGPRGMHGNEAGWTGGFAPEGSWHVGDFERHGGRNGMRSGSQRAADPWEIPGPHTGRGPEGYSRSEQAIREDVCERLTRHGALDASGITVRVEQGEVILEGSVESRQAKRMAEDAAESVSGVRDVQNLLRVSRD